MRTVPSLAFLSIVVYFLTNSNCGAVDGFNHENRVASTPESFEIPKDWKVIDTSRFTFSLPPQMKDKKVQGIDSHIWQFDGPDMSLSIEEGMYTSDFTFEGDRYESLKKKVTVNGLDATRIVLDLNKPKLQNWSFNADGSTRVKTHEQNLVVGLHFPSKETHFWLKRTSHVPENTADLILNSIKFKN